MNFTGKGFSTVTRTEKVESNFVLIEQSGQLNDEGREKRIRVYIGSQISSLLNLNNDGNDRVTFDQSNGELYLLNVTNTTIKGDTVRNTDCSFSNKNLIKAVNDSFGHGTFSASVVEGASIGDTTIYAVKLSHVVEQTTLAEEVQEIEQVVNGNW